MNAINKSGDVCPPLIFFFYMYAMIERVIQMKASASRLPIPTSGDDGIEMHFSWRWIIFKAVIIESNGLRVKP